MQDSRICPTMSQERESGDTYIKKVVPILVTTFFVSSYLRSVHENYGGPH
jgi:hypothetical protein